MNIEIVCVRDPDSENIFAVFLDGVLHGTDNNADVEVTIHDIDPGRGGVYPEWVKTELDYAEKLTPAAGRFVKEIVNGYDITHDNDGRELT